ncbi:MAG TPA: YceI family protein [Solirubrobacteraceae bacterium]|nr:YceI family protein [Solirubrobacteraceae bacterium]
MSTATQPLAGTFAADPVHSSCQFAVKHMKVATFRAGCDDVDARLVAGDDGVTLEGRAKVESVSVANPPELREHLVNSTDFFDAGNHPEIVFTSKDVDLAEDGTATVEGELTIKGITKPVTATGTYQAPVEDPYGGVRSALELTATLDRREWEMNWQAPLPSGDDVLAWDVTLSVNLELVRQDA